MRSFTVAFATIAAVVAVSCDKMPLTSPTGSTITLAVDQSILPVNGQATLTATVIESAGTAVHNGTMVSFTPTLGRTEPSEAPTLNGRATVKYIAPSVSGTVTINAFSGSASTVAAGNTSAGGVTIRIGAAAVGSVSLNAVPANVAPTGGTVTVSARVLDSSNNPLPNVAVLFSAVAGTLGSTSAFTDSEGVARTTLTTNQSTLVTATVGDKSGTFTIAISATPVVQIRVDTAAPTEGQPVNFTVTPGTTTSSNSSPSNLVAVTIDYGDGSSVQTVSAPTGPFGVSHTYNRAQGYIVTATAIDSNGARGSSTVPVTVGFAAQPTGSITVTPNPVPSSAQGLATFTVTATPASATAGPPIRNVRVTLADGTVLYNSSSGGGFAYKFGGAGTYTVFLTVTDAAGQTGTSSTVVVVQVW